MNSKLPVASGASAIGVLFVGLFLLPLTLGRPTTAPLNAASPCASAPCQNGGTCRLWTFPTYLCSCGSHFNGPNCETSVSPCASAPCENGGTCSTLGLHIYHCRCPSPFTGRNCHTNQVADALHNISMVLADALQRLEAVERGAERPIGNGQKVEALAAKIAKKFGAVVGNLTILRSAEIPLKALDTKIKEKFRVVERNLTVLRTAVNAQSQKTPPLLQMSTRVAQAERRISEHERYWASLRRFMCCF